MLGWARPVVARVVAPVVGVLARTGVTADMVTVVGFLGAVGGSVLLIARGELFWGAVVVTVSVLLDMLDGALARARGGGTMWGAVLDSTLDRAADAAVFGALIWWFAGPGADRVLLLLALLCLVLSVLTSYVKARAEGVGLRCDVGVIERTERLMLVLIGTGLGGLGLPYVLPVTLWILLVGSVITVGQRITAVHRAAAGRRLPAPASPPPAS